MEDEGGVVLDADGEVDVDRTLQVRVKHKPGISEECWESALCYRQRTARHDATTTSLSPSIHLPFTTSLSPPFHLPFASFPTAAL